MLLHPNLRLSRILLEVNPAGVSLNAITRTIDVNLLEVLAEKDIPRPIESIDNEYIT